MSVHEKMQSDYLWVRHAPVEEGLKTRNHGFYYMYDKAPNGPQRLEMTYRSIGKQFDWELQKFRLGRKGVDKGNKKRGLKNLFRFIKNPYGYFYWKAGQGMLSTTPKILSLGAVVYFSMLLVFWKRQSEEADNLDTLLIANGKNVEGSAGRMKGYFNKGHFLGFNHFEAGMKTPFRNEWVTLNPTFRQNVRKQLQLTNNYNVVF